MQLMHLNVEWMLNEMRRGIRGLVRFGPDGSASQDLFKNLENFMIKWTLLRVNARPLLRESLSSLIHREAQTLFKSGHKEEI